MDLGMLVPVQKKTVVLVFKLPYAHQKGTFGNLLIKMEFVHVASRPVKYENRANKHEKYSLQFTSIYYILYLVACQESGRKKQKRKMKGTEI